MKSVKNQGKIKTQTGLDGCDKARGAWAHIAEAEVVSLDPDQILANIKQISENTGNTPHLVPIETKESKADVNGGRQGGSLRELSPNPGIPILDQGASEKEVLKALGLIAAKTRDLQGITERSKAGRGAEYPHGQSAN